MDLQPKNVANVEQNPFLSSFRQFFLISFLKGPSHHVANAAP